MKRTRKETLAEPVEHGLDPVRDRSEERRLRLTVAMAAIAERERNTTKEPSNDDD